MELGETSPDLEQSKKLSQIFNVSLDDLVNNDIKKVLIEKVSNTEKLTKIIMNILKIILFIIIIYALLIVCKIAFEEYFAVETKNLTISFTCTINDEEFSYRIWQNSEKNNVLQLYTDDSNLNIDSTKYDDYNWLMNDIDKNVVLRGGSCD